MEEFGIIDDGRILGLSRGIISSSLHPLVVYKYGIRLFDRNSNGSIGRTIGDAILSNVFHNNVVLIYYKVLRLGEVVGIVVEGPRLY